MNEQLSRLSGETLARLNVVVSGLANNVMNQDECRALNIMLMDINKAGVANCGLKEFCHEVKEVEGVVGK